MYCRGSRLIFFVELDSLISTVMVFTGVIDFECVLVRLA
jgi:hypothetical protein